MKKIMFVWAALAAPAWGQLTLDQAVAQAVEKYPAIRASLADVAEAAAGVNAARASFLPRADFVGQINRATHNNTFGMLLPQSAISGISGPVLGTNSVNNVWGTAVGALVTWEPFDFGLRKANVGVAQAARERALAQAAVTRLQVGAAAADAFLTILAAERTVIAAQAGVERARVLDEVVAALVKNELRPGAEASRIKAELAVARTGLIQSERAVEVARAALAQLLNVDVAAVSVAAGKLFNAAPEDEGAAGAARHPAAAAQNAVVEEAKARQRALNRAYFPRFSVQGTSYARGTGAQASGATGGGAAGLGPNIQNWGLGMTVLFPALDFPAIRAKREIEEARREGEAARYQRVVQEVNGEAARAKANLRGARRIAENTPIQLEAARAAERQASARYRAGLGTIVEVAEAQRMLTQSEIDDGLARLGVWRALLGLAGAQGDLTAFLTAAR